MEYLHELQFVWAPVTRKLVNIYFMVVDCLYISTYVAFMTIYILNRPNECNGTSVSWLLMTSFILLVCMIMMRGTVNHLTMLPKIRIYDVKCYIYLLIFMYMWGLFNIYMNECYFSDNYDIVCRDIYDCKSVYLFLMINSNVYFVWINSVIIHMVLCMFYHSRKKQRISSIVEITELGENTECSICLDELRHRRVVRTPCNHFYHYECIIEWMGVQMSCPICRLNL